MIDKHTGELYLNQNPPIGHNTELQDMLDWTWTEPPVVHNMGNGWSHLVARNVEAADGRVHFTFFFLNNKLKRISFCLEHKDQAHPQGWDNWSEKEELNKLAHYQAWLDREVGTQREFTWGILWASFDRKGGSTSIGLSYHDQLNPRGDNP